MAYPGVGGSQPASDTTAAVPQPAESEDRGSIPAIVEGLSYVVWEMVRPIRSDEPTPGWVIPAWGVILGVMGVIGVVTGKAGGSLWHESWIGSAMLDVTVLYLGFKLIWKLVPKPQPRDDQSPPGRHSAG